MEKYHITPLGICGYCEKQHNKISSAQGRRITALQKTNIELNQRNMTLISAINKGIKEGQIQSFKGLSDALAMCGNPIVITTAINPVITIKEFKKKTWAELKLEWGLS